MQANHRPRKACDLCYTRKIKCDGQQPRCSNCVNYKTSCTHTARSRKWKPKAQQPGETSEADEIRILQAQMQQLQDKLAQYQIQDTTPSSSALSPSVGSGDGLAQIGNAVPLMKLPPLQQTMHMVGTFLNTVNSVLPLFHPDSLLRLVGETYAVQPRQRDPVAWAAINVVLALACQQIPNGEDPYLQYGVASEYLDKAQSVVWAVTLGDTRLLNIQTLVGMAMVLETHGADKTPALVIISAAMRLIHKMGLHDRRYSAHLDVTERTQYARVFWLAYIVDKDLSMRTQQPSVQLDDDIDVDIPASTAAIEGGDSAAGIVTTADGNNKIDYFQSRVQLAHIQGSIYDHLYSTRASKRSPEERQAIREDIIKALDEWKASVPVDFSATNVIATTCNNPSMASFFCILHTTSLFCLVLNTQAHAWDEQWVMGLRDHGRGSRTLQLPGEWTGMVAEARDFMILYEQVCLRHEWLRWMVTCTYTSAMVLLTINNLNDLQHPEFERDSDRIQKSLDWFKETTKEVNSNLACVLADVCTEAFGTMKQRRADDIALALGGDWLVGFLDDLEHSE
ncbi:fungal-specific transcription factor domain-containing protein [Fusarium tricinctum]|uniref:Fungal-specific transcription factor domain-containing protein n=1 Tax=Fusarium tricinctum TaxID=61284 RepID=A0A8K0RT89_9HYPO|nr:fungal-specific transcription factor domain-containing protein [Fusarium tricinctum]